MDKRLEEIILEIALEDYESGHTTASDKESFNKILKDDFNLEVGDEAFDFYAECRNMGPSGFYLMYKNELDFSPEFKAEYGFEEDEEEIEEIIEESLMEATPDEGSFKVQQIDSEGNKLDQFVNFATADEAIAFAKTLKTPAEVIDTTLSESLKEEKVIWTNLDTLEEALSRDDMIADLKAKGKNYNFNKYTDAQIYRMHQREMNKKAVKPSLTLADTDDEEDVEYIETSNCPQCNHQLTDAGQCPVCDLGDEEERTSHMLHLDESPEELNEGNSLTNKSTDESLLGAIGSMAAGAIGTYIGNKLSEEQESDQEVLVEGPISRLTKKMDKVDTKINNKVDKLANPKNIGKILYSTYRDQSNSYFVDGEWKTSKDILPNLKSAIQSLSTYDKALTTISKDEVDPNLIKFINAIVRDKNGYIIRRGLELIKPGTVPFNPTRLDLMEIKNGFKAEDIIATRAPKKTSPTTQEQEQSKQETPEAETTAEQAPKQETPVETNKPEQPKDNWVTNNSIKATITLRAKRKNGNALYYDKAGNKIDYRNINVDNISDVFVDKEGKIPFMKAMEEVKAGLAKRKAAAIKSAALFGESLDDEMEYDNLEEKVITHDSLQDGDMEELLDLAKDIGINTMGELEQFAEREVPQGTSLIDTLRQYRDDLGDDFEVKEDFDMSPESDVDAFDETGDMSWFNR